MFRPVNKMGVCVCVCLYAYTIEKNVTGKQQLKYEISGERNQISAVWVFKCW